jgi:opacity protein-like surface antigen
MRVRKLAFVLVAGLLLALPAQARADWIFTPYVGVNFGGDTIDNNVNYGASFGFMGAGIIGVEFDFSYSPNFYDTNNDLDPFDSEGNVTSVMGNIILGAPIGGMDRGVRPYASAGVGLLRSDVTSVGNLFDFNENSFGMNAGAGVMGFFSDNVGIRGDIRYFRAFSDTDPDPDVDFDLSVGDFDYWRGSVGLTFRF